MPIIKKAIQATIKEMLCKCGAGVYRLVDDLPVTDSNPKQWIHKCSSCGARCHITAIYPIIEYKGKDFMLADSLRYTRNPNSTSIGKHKFD